MSSASTRDRDGEREKDLGGRGCTRKKDDAAAGAAFLENAYQKKNENAYKNKNKP